MQALSQVQKAGEACGRFVACRFKPLTYQGLAKAGERSAVRRATQLSENETQVRSREGVEVGGWLAEPGRG